MKTLKYHWHHLNLNMVSFVVMIMYVSPIVVWPSVELDKRTTVWRVWLYHNCKLFSSHLFLGRSLDDVSTTTRDYWSSYSIEYTIRMFKIFAKFFLLRLNLEKWATTELSFYSLGRNSKPRTTWFLWEKWLYCHSKFDFTRNSRYISVNI